MSRKKLLLTTLVVAAATFALPALAQGVLQTPSLMKIDPLSLASGYRTSKVVGSVVYNESKESVGKIDDLIVTKDDKVPFAVLSIGGSLGMGNRYIVVPYNALEVIDAQIVLRGATKESLKTLPEFAYSK